MIVTIMPSRSRAQSAQGYLAMGDSCFYCEATDTALVFYEDAYRIAPHERETLVRLVRAYSDMGWLHLHKDTSAQRYYECAALYADTLLALDPQNPSSHFWAALTRGSLIPFSTVSQKLHLGKEVRAQANETIRLDSTFALAYIILAIFERESARLSWFERTIAKIIFGEDLHGSFTESEALLNKAVKYDPENSYAYYEFYWTYRAEGKKDAAAESLKKVMSLPVHSQREERQRELAKNYLADLESSEH